jgi:NADPH2 dehydrogenase
MKNAYPKIASLNTEEKFLEAINNLGISIPFDRNIIPAPEGPLAQSFQLEGGKRIGNRFCIQPMEGWDGTPNGKPTEFTIRRWKNFGLSGAKLIWGGEAAAVTPSGRANPNQLMILDSTMSAIEDLRKALVSEHKSHIGDTSDLFIGLQLTHSGRFCKPNEKTKFEPKILYDHPALNKIYHTSPDTPILTDMEIEDLIEEFIQAAKRAQIIGFDFVDVKHCHGYLGHEFLSAYKRPGKYGGSFENRVRFLREIVQGIKRDCPGLIIGVRLSMFDVPPS